MTMNIKFSKRNKGFTIIELMIVLVIVAILLAIAYPSYVQYVRKANRGDAQQLLMNWAVNQEIWRSNNTSYNEIVDPNADGYMIPKMEDRKYSFTVAADATSYTLAATASGDQLKDKARDGTPCGTLTINQNGVKEPAACWE